MSWRWVVALSSAVILINLLIVWLFFRESSVTRRTGSAGLRAALQDAQRVLGSGRFALLVAVPIVVLMLAGGGWLSWRNGLLRAGVLSGSGYEWLALQRGEPMLMWALFAVVAALTALALYVFNIFLAPRRFALGAHALTSAGKPAGEIA